MPPSMIGVDIGTTAVRAVELERTRSGLALRAFGQVGLPAGAVVDGEVADVEAVAAALKKLWHASGISGRRVVLGVSSQRVIVRQAEVPAMSAADFRSASKFEAEKLIPLPSDETELSFAMLDSPEQVKASTTMRVLLAAAHRDVVAGHLAAAGGASLEVDAVDVGALAMIRASRRSRRPEAPGSHEHDAVVGIGSGLTTVAVDEGGAAAFVRVVAGGGATLTAQLQAEIEAPPDVAESYKRTAHGHAISVLERASEPLVGDVAQSLDFFVAQNPDRRIRTVALTGGGALAAGVFESLQREVSYPVDFADAFAGIDTSRFADQPELLRRSSAQLLTAVGLAEWSAAPAVERLSLLPAAVMRSRERRRDITRAAVAVAGVAVVLGAAWAYQDHRVSQEEQVSAGYRSAAAVSQARLDALAPVNSYFSSVNGRIQADRQALSGSVDWRAVIAQVAAVMPKGTVLTSFSVTPGALPTTTGSAASTQSSATVPAAGSTVTMDIQAPGTVDEVSTWLRAMARVPSLTGAWVASATQTAASPGHPALVTFTCTASVSDRAPVQHPSIGVGS